MGSHKKQLRYPQINDRWFNQSPLSTSITIASCGPTQGPERAVPPTHSLPIPSSHLIRITWIQGIPVLRPVSARYETSYTGQSMKPQPQNCPASDTARRKPYCMRRNCLTPTKHTSSSLIRPKDQDRRDRVSSSLILAGTGGEG